MTQAIRSGLYFELYKRVYLINKTIVKLRFYLPETTLAYDRFNDFTLILYSLDEYQFPQVITQEFISYFNEYI